MELDIWKIYQKGSVVGKFSLWGSETIPSSREGLSQEVEITLICSTNRRKISRLRFEKIAVFTQPGATKAHPAEAVGNSPRQC
jgi:hypothetical protein